MVTLTREQLEERLATLHQASLELVKDLSLETVLNRIVRLAREQANARYAALGLSKPHGSGLKSFIQVGMTDDEELAMSHPPIGLGLIGALAEERRTIRIPEIKNDPRSVGFPANHPPMDSFLGVPILSGSKSLGQIYLTNKLNADTFTIDDEIVIETLAAYAAVAIENALLYESVVERDNAIKQHNQDLTLLDNLAKILAASLEEDDIISQTLSHVIQYLGVEAGEIFLREEGTKDLRMANHWGEAAEAFWTKDRFLIGEGFVGRVAQVGEILVSNSLETDMRFLRRAVVNAGFKTLVAIPLIARGKVVGVMNVATMNKRQFDARELDLLEAIGTWAGTAIENARLHRQARRLAILEERERIGMDLHDGTIQSVYAVGLALEYAKVSLFDDPETARKKIDQSIEGLNKAIQEIRSYILDLRPRQMRGQESLKSAIRRLLEEFKTNTDTKASLSTSTDKLDDLSPESNTALFHICQEALGNAAKHARANSVDVNIWSNGSRVMMEVKDDGIGFDLDKTNLNIGHGLSNMHRRARRVGGDVEISAQPNIGTTIMAWVPLNHHNQNLDSSEIFEED